MTHANKWPMRMVPRQEVNEAIVIAGPKTTIIIPTRKISVRIGLQTFRENDPGPSGTDWVL